MIRVNVFHGSIVVKVTALTLQPFSGGGVILGEIRGSSIFVKRKGPFVPNKGPQATVCRPVVDFRCIVG